jgi:hypothetical protein
LDKYSVMDAIIRVSSLEFNEELFKKIGDLISGKDAEIVISVKDKTIPFLPKETNDEYWKRIESSIMEIEAGKGTTFTMEEFKRLVYNDLPA